jgi:hypothetical protein
VTLKNISLFTACDIHVGFVQYWLFILVEKSASVLFRWRSLIKFVRRKNYGDAYNDTSTRELEANSLLGERKKFLGFRLGGWCQNV